VGTVADTALAHGNHYRHRAAVVTDNLGGLGQGMRSIQDRTPNPDVVGPALAPTTRPRMVFVYTGHGGHPPRRRGGPDAGARLRPDEGPSADRTASPCPPTGVATRAEQRRVRGRPTLHLPGTGRAHRTTGRTRHRPRRHLGPFGGRGRRCPHRR